MKQEEGFFPVEKIRIPLIKMIMPEMPSMDAYEQVMSATMDQLKSMGA